VRAVTPAGADGSNDETIGTEPVVARAGALASTFSERAAPPGSAEKNSLARRAITAGSDSVNIAADP